MPDSHTHISHFVRQHSKSHCTVAIHFICRFHGSIFLVVGCVLIFNLTKFISPNKFPSGLAFSMWHVSLYDYTTRSHPSKRKKSNNNETGLIQLLINPSFFGRRNKKTSIHFISSVCRKKEIKEKAKKNEEP